MADVTYNASSFPALVTTLRNLLALKPRSPSPLILLAYKERDSSERELWPMLRERAGVTLQKIDGIPGSGGQEVEIWLGQCN
jgi:protein N-lysine methyltransferase METTL21D